MSGDDLRESPRGLHLHFDGVCGAAGDMLLGAFLDLGVPEEVLRDALDRVGIGGERLAIERVVKGGISAVDVKVRVDSAEGHGAHRHYHEIRSLLDRADLSAEARRRAGDIFARIARAESAIHGVPVDEVHFHEVGAIDSIADVVGAAAALAWLDPPSVSAQPVALGRGSLRSAHGVMPVPSPAALEILREVAAPVCEGGASRELCTPTGAAVLASAVTAWGAMPPLAPRAIGYGAGDAELGDRANVVRVTAGRPLEGAGAGAALEQVVRVEAGVDDATPELCANAAEALLAAGALDVYWTPATMKKGRPGVQLTLLCREPDLPAVLEVVFRETTSIGVRFDRVTRQVLSRETRSVTTRFGSLPVKVARLGERILNAAPEFDACREAARRAGAPLKEVVAAAVAAWERERPES